MISSTVASFLISAGADPLLSIKSVASFFKLGAETYHFSVRSPPARSSLLPFALCHLPFFLPADCRLPTDEEERKEGADLPQGFEAVNKLDPATDQHGLARISLLF